MVDVFLCEGARTPVGRYGGALSSVRPDDLLAHAIKATLARAPKLDPYAIDEVSSRARRAKPFRATPRSSIRPSAGASSIR
jgi:acetyl-CoA acetyltransferase